MQTILSFLSSLSERIGRALRSMLRLPSLPAGDLLHDRNYRRIFASVIITHFGAQITMLALPLTAATVLNATPTQMGFLMAAEIVPFVLLSLPAGVWLDRVRKLPVYVAGDRDANYQTVYEVLTLLQREANVSRAGLMGNPADSKGK